MLAIVLRIPSSAGGRQTSLETVTSSIGRTRPMLERLPHAYDLVNGPLPAHDGADHGPGEEPGVLRGARLLVRAGHGHHPGRRARGDELLLRHRRPGIGAGADVQPRRPHV